MSLVVIMLSSQQLYFNIGSCLSVLTSIMDYLLKLSSLSGNSSCNIMFSILSEALISLHLANWFRSRSWEVSPPILLLFSLGIRLCEFFPYLFLLLPEVSFYQQAFG